MEVSVGSYLGFNYDKGFAELVSLVQDSSQQEKIAELKPQLAKNIRDERLFGGTEQSRNERSRILYDLNAISLQVCQRSFIDMCL